MIGYQKPTKLTGIYKPTSINHTHHYPTSANTIHKPSSHTQHYPTSPGHQPTIHRPYPSFSPWSPRRSEVNPGPNSRAPMGSQPVGQEFLVRKPNWWAAAGSLDRPCSRLDPCWNDTCRSEMPFTYYMYIMQDVFWYLIWWVVVVVEHSQEWLKNWRIFVYNQINWWFCHLQESTATGQSNWCWHNGRFLWDLALSVGSLKPWWCHDAWRERQIFPWLRVVECGVCPMNPSYWWTSGINIRCNVEPGTPSQRSKNCSRKRMVWMRIYWISGNNLFPNPEMDLKTLRPVVIIPHPHIDMDFLIFLFG